MRQAGSVFLSLSLLLGAAVSAQELDWKPTLKEAQQVAKLADLPIFFVVVRAGNEACEKMKATFNNEKVIEEFMDNCALLRLSADDQDTVKFLNQRRLRATDVPFMCLLEKNQRDAKTTYTGYLNPEDFLVNFKTALEMADSEDALSPVQKMMRRNQDADRYRLGRYYKKALECLEEARKIAAELNATNTVKNYIEDMGTIDKYGQLELKKARQRMAKGEKEAAIGLIKRVILEFEDRPADLEGNPATDGKALLEEYKKDPALAELVEKTEPWAEGFVDPTEVLSTTRDDMEEEEEKKKPPKPDDLLRLKLKDGTTLTGTIISPAGDKIFFKTYSEDPRLQKSQFIKKSDIVSQEAVED